VQTPIRDLIKTCPVYCDVKRKDKSIHMTSSDVNKTVSYLLNIE